MKTDHLAQEREGEELESLLDDETILRTPEERARKILPLLLTILLVGPLLVWMVQALRPEGTLRITRWPNGYTRTEETFRELGRGPVRHGPAREFHESGRLAAKGTYENDLREGAWEFFDAAGAADRGRSGLYEQGSRISP